MYVCVCVCTFAKGCSELDWAAEDDGDEAFDIQYVKPGLEAWLRPNPSTLSSFKRATARSGLFEHHRKCSTEDNQRWLLLLRGTGCLTVAFFVASSRATTHKDLTLLEAPSLESWARLCLF